jgi:hypothetical protein
MLLIFYVIYTHLIVFVENFKKTPLFHHKLTNCIQKTMKIRDLSKLSVNEDSKLCCTIMGATENMD